MLETLAKLRDVLGTLQKQPDHDVTRLIASRPPISGSLRGRSQPLKSSEAESIAYNIENYAQKLADDSNKINTILDENPLLRPELSSTVTWSQEKITAFTSSIFTVAQVLRQLAKMMQGDASVNPFILEQSNDLAARSSAYYQWLNDSIQRIEVKTQEIRNWR